MNMPNIKLVADGGCPKKYLENTLSSFVEAIASGALFLKTDVQLSADLVPVLFTEPSLSPSYDAQGSVHQHSFDELSGLRPAGQKPETNTHAYITSLANLVTLLGAHPYVHAFIEVKDCTLVAHGIAPVYREITKCLLPIMDQSTLISRSLKFMRFAQKQSWPGLGFILASWCDGQSEEVKRLMPSYVFCEHNLLPNDNPIEQQKSSVVASSVSDPRTALRLRERGIQYIATRDFIGLHQALSQDS